MPAPPKGNDSSGALDHSLATLFKIAKEQKKEKESIDAKRCEIEVDARVDQLVGLLNCYANWELRGLLVAVLKDGKVDSLMTRLGTEDSVGTSTTDEISSSSNENVTSRDAQKKSLEENSALQPGLTSDRRARRSSSREDLRALSKLGRSTSVSRSNNGATGRRRISRSVSADKQISDMASGIKKRDMDTSSRQSAILARRRELDNDSSAERPRDRGKTPPKSNSQTKERRSLTPTRSLPAAPTSFRRPMRQRSGSAENMLGLLPNSSHGGRRSSGGSRLARNHTVGGTNLGISLHGTSSERSVPSRTLQRSNSLRLSSEDLVNDKAGLEISTRSTGRRRSSRLPRGSSLESVQVAIDHNKGELLTSSAVANSADDKDCYKNTEFLQFHPGPGDAQVKACSQKVEISNIVDELKLSAHNPIKVDTNNVPSVKKSFTLFRSKPKKSGGIQLDDDSYDNDSDEESIY